MLSILRELVSTWRNCGFAGLTSGDKRLPLPQGSGAAVLVSGSVDEMALQGNVVDVAEAVTRLYLRSKEDTFDWRASPLLVPSVEGLSPAIIWAGEWEVLRDESRAFANRLREAGVDVTYIEGPQQPHAGIYGVNPKTGKPTRYSQETVPKANALMRRYIGPKS